MKLFRRKFDKDYFSWPFTHTHPLSRRNLTRLELILRHKEGGTLLEIGTGTGDFMELAATRFQVQAIDISPYAASAVPAVLRDQVTVGDVETIDFPGGPYDVITAFNVLEHLRRPSAVIRKVGQSLAPGGIFVGSVPSNTHVVGTVITAVSTVVDRTHISCYRAATWRRAFATADFSDTQFFGEIMLDGKVCKYIFGRMWPHISFNMMFLARGPAPTVPA